MSRPPRPRSSNLNAQIAFQKSVIQQQAAEIAAAEAKLKFAQQERARYEELMKTGSGTVQRAQQTDAALREKTAQLQQGKAGLMAANRRSTCSQQSAPEPTRNSITPARSSSRRS